MLVKTYITGMLENNNYLLYDEKSKEAVLFDCTEYLPEIQTFLTNNNATLKYVLLTHGHFDHILGLKELHENMPNVPIYAHKDDKDLIENVATFVDRFVGGLGKVDVPPITKYIDENEDLTIGEEKIKIYHTPGHTKGGVCYFVDDKLFSGDTIFLGSVGRTDLPGGSYESLRNSVRQVLNNLDENVKIYTGHGDLTTVGYEKQNNPVL